MWDNVPMIPKLTLAFLGFVSWLIFPSIAGAELRPDKVYLAEGKKTQHYVRDGLITGGDKAIDEFVVKDIRRAVNPGYERVVIDLGGSRGEDSVAVERPPYFQVAVTPDEKRLVLTVFGKPRLDFDSRKVSELFRKSPVVERLMLLPSLEESSWTFAVEMKSGKPVEVFELSNPVRLIVDIKTQ